jgi:hypothetical protein
MRDPVTPEVYEAVFLRDGQCVISTFDEAHVCRDAWGDRHEPDDIPRLTLDHVKSNLMLGRRAASDPAHLVVMCGWTNVVLHPTKYQRQRVREYLMRFVARDVA